MAIRKRTVDTGLEELDIYQGDDTAEDNNRLMREAAQRQAESGSTWLDKLEQDAAAKRDSERESKIVRSNAALVCGLCRTVRKLLADGRIASVEAAYWPWVLGYEAKMLDIRPREPAAKYGIENLISFRGSWVKATEQEARILGFMQDRNEAALSDFAKAGWTRRDVPRGTIDKALTGLRTKLLDSKPPTRFQFFRRDDRIVVE